MRRDGSLSCRSNTVDCTRDPLSRTHERAIRLIPGQSTYQLVAKPGVLVKRFRKSTARCRRRRRTTRSAFRPRRFLLTRNEARFFRVMTTVVGPHCLISCKVRLADIITCSDQGWQLGCANRISQKHVDFVLSCPNTSRILAAVELDDRSHRLRERKRRDVFVNRLFRTMRVRLIRVPARWTYDRQVVRDILVENGILVENEIDHGSTSPKPLNPRRAQPGK